MTTTYYKNNPIDFMIGLFLFLVPNILIAFLPLIKNFFQHYIFVELMRAEVMYRITAPVDEKIPFKASAILPYFSFLLNLVSFIGYLFRNLGFNVLPEIKSIFLDVSLLYKDGGFVYRTAPTVFHRKGRSVVTSMLRIFDSEKNSAPSMHVAFASLIYERGLEIVTKHQLGDVAQTKQELLRVAVRVIDATLLIKQHSVRDVATGLVLLYSRNFQDDQSALELIDNIFKHSNVVIDPSLDGEVKREIKSLYLELVKNTNPVLGMIDYIKGLPVD